MCTNCNHSSNNIELKVGLHIYTASKSACCPIKGIITYFDSRIVRYKDVHNQEHSKPKDIFMKSSWLDNSWNI